MEFMEEDAGKFSGRTKTAANHGGFFMRIGREF